jgi:hypothetical protein
MYMWNQVNYTQSYYANIGTSALYNQWSYLMVSCPHHATTLIIFAIFKRKKQLKNSHESTAQ